MCPGIFANKLTETPPQCQQASVATRFHDAATLHDVNDVALANRIEPVSNHDYGFLPTEFVDIVTLNKYGQLSLIELKLEKGSGVSCWSSSLFPARLNFRSAALNQSLDFSFKRFHELILVCRVNQAFHRRIQKAKRTPFPNGVNVNRAFVL